MKFDAPQECEHDNGTPDKELLLVLEPGGCQGDCLIM